MNKIKNKKSEGGFTLIEMLVVVMIIGLIGAVVGSKVMDSYGKAQIEAAKTQMRQLGGSLDQFKLECGFYPTSDQGLDALLAKPAGRDCKNYDPSGYISGKKIPADPWNNAYLYESDGSKYEIKCLASDAKEGGDGTAKDLTSNDLN